MKRFTQYLYEYQKERKVRNIGFVKAEQGEKRCVLQIQGRNFAVGKNAKWKVYLFYKSGAHYEGVCQGEVPERVR